MTTAGRLFLVMILTTGKLTFAGLGQTLRMRVFVQPVPPPHPVGQVHVLVFQQIPPDQRGVVTRDCLSQPGVTCSVWHWGRELTDVSDFRSEHGFGLNLIIHRPFLHTWEPDDDLNLM